MINMCACMGKQGADPYCPCEMEQRGLVATPTWSEDDVVRLEAALSKMYGWQGTVEEIKRG
jgi:hypothetical protein